ncbi:YigZ family protein [Flexithrix dorotheae]|uniref:YigZ family protein n=1 Tax=Flexithrix dorotheae TaxID=70993 RepID=UPI0003685E2C|nr:YigZ family protein [Flexithrix dorotheae]
MEEDSYFTIKAVAEGIYKEKGSKFYAFAYPVSNEDEIKSCLQELKKQYYDARHHCYAYILGKDKLNYRSNDDGEPGNSAGPPILGQIRSKELTDVLVVVVRYFGGTKLGVGGLITAYKTSTQEALENAEIITKYLEKEFKITFEYPQMNDVMKLVKDFDLKILDQYFEQDCVMRLIVREKYANELELKLKKIDGLRLKVY